MIRLRTTISDPRQPRAGGHAAWLATWAVAVLAGFALLQRYAATPGAVAAAPEHWPQGSGLHRGLERPTLVMFLHPHCPCSRASVEELARVLAQAPGRAELNVVFIRPEGCGEGWERSTLWDTVSQLPGVSVVLDLHGAEAERFGATTSGMTLLFSRAGEVVFSGGITASRGHEGDNAGKAAVLAGLLGQPSGTRTTPTFGCPLFDGARPSGGRS